MWNGERSTSTTETWWWNRDAEEVVAKRKVCHKAWRKSKSAEDTHNLDVVKKEVLQDC